MEKSSNSKRYLLPDTVRGILVIGMIVYHLMFDLCYIFEVNMPWFSGTAMRLFQQSILTGFIFLSGFCFPMGKRKLFRAVQISVCGLIITAVTWIFMPSQRIVFGVLTCIGICMLLVMLFEKPFSRINPIIGFILFIILALLTYGVRSGNIGIYTHPLFELPDALYETSFLFPFGFKNADFRSSDYVPLLPWFFVYAGGFFIYKAFQKYSRTDTVLRYGIRPLATLGRYSLWIYMAHQPIIYAVLWLTFKLI